MQAWMASAGINGSLHGNFFVCDVWLKLQNQGPVLETHVTWCCRQRSLGVREEAYSTKHSKSEVLAEHTKKRRLW